MVQNKTLPFATDEIQGFRSTTYYRNTEMKHAEILCTSSPLCFLLQRKVKDNNIKKKGTHKSVFT